MKSLEELKAIREKIEPQIQIRKEGTDRKKVIISLGECGIDKGAREVLNTMAAIAQEQRLYDVMVSQTGCIGLCPYEPVVEVSIPGQDKVTYVEMDAEKAKRVMDEHLCKGSVVAEYMLGGRLE